MNKKYKKGSEDKNSDPFALQYLKDHHYRFFKTFIHYK